LVLEGLAVVLRQQTELTLYFIQSHQLAAVALLLEIKAIMAVQAAAAVMACQVLVEQVMRAVIVQQREQMAAMVRQGALALEVARLQQEATLRQILEAMAAVELHHQLLVHR
jgi:hypothetical protein